ncbi:YncE family protein [Stenotrophomonas sp. CPCC 101365]|uniref:YncE family protein n=1 Tax=Stenotrophomonas mori TaxID=2871096 RepID=A0ABT0SJ49_9GAMM|nr:YncE family protein [Stenotrophomonas mori]
MSLKSQLVTPGSTAELAGEGFKPGQRVTLLRGTTVLNPQAWVADGEGRFSASVALPQDAAPGRHPLLVRVDSPDAAAVFTLKVSPDLPLQGASGFAVRDAHVVRGLYQSGYSAASNALFVTSAVGRPPVTQSELVKLDPRTLKVQARATPAPAPAPPAAAGQPPRDGGVYAVYGVGVDDANGNVWVTNTRQDSIAVYRQSDLSLVKQFPVGTVSHARDVLVDAQRGKAFVSATGGNHIAVFDAATLQPAADIEIASSLRGGQFTPMSLALDAEAGKLYTVSISSPEAAVIDVASGKVEKVIPLSNAESASGVAWDAGAKRLLVASQGSDNLLIVDPASGRIEHDVAVGAAPLNIAVDPVSGLAYVSSRASGNLAVVDRSGTLVANLDGGTFPNHVHADGKGSVFAVNKSQGENDPRGDRVTRIEKRAR